MPIGCSCWLSSSQAGARVSDEGRDAAPGVPWPEIVAMRNRLVHVYFDVNLDVVWETVRQDLPPLVAALQGALNESETR